jgi:GNAT superfamily N-acetyltransferase
MTRTIRPWETPEVANLAKEFHDLAQCGTIFSPTRFWQTIAHLEGSDSLFLHGYFLDDGTMAGLLIGTISPQMMTDTVVAQEIMWYVQPEYRNTLGSVRLLSDFEQWAKKRGADGIIMASFTATEEQKLGEFYRRRGYQHLETHLLKLL